MEVSLQLHGLGKAAELDKAQRQTMQTMKILGFSRCCFSSSEEVAQGDEGQQDVEGLLLPKSSSVLGLGAR